MNSENSNNTNIESADQTVGHSFVESADQFLDELNQLATTTGDRSEFYRRLVDDLHHVIDAADVSVWVRDRDESYTRVFQKRDAELNAEVIELEGDCLDQNVEAKRTEFFSNDVGSAFAIPIAADSHEVKIISAVVCECLDARLAKVFCDLGDAIADIALNFERRLVVENQQQKFAQLESFVQLLKNSNSSLDLKKTGFHLTNDCRAFLNAGRVWLFDASGRLKLIACSSVNNVNPRSRSFRSLRKLVARVIKQNESTTYVSRELKDKPDCGLAADYAESESLNGVYVRPLKRVEGQVIDGVLVVEYFQSHDEMATLQSLSNIVPCVEAAVSNAIQFEKIPFRRPLLTVRWLLEQFRLHSLPRTLLVMAGFIGMIAAMFLIEADFEIEVVGELRPVIERHVFAPVDATVENVGVDYGDIVSVGQVLAWLGSMDYELKTSALQNELSAAQKELEANQILHTQASNEGKDSLYLGQLSAEIEQNRFAIEAINEKISWYLNKTKSLEIEAPISGMVISRDVKMSLLKRPVLAGNRLLTVADVQSDWQIVFEIPDREFGYLLAAKRDVEGSEWVIDYRYQSDLETTHESRINHVDENNSFDEDGNAFVRAFVPIENGTEDFRVGQTVIGKIHCGRKSLFFIWTRDVRDFLKSNFFWI